MKAWIPWAILGAAVIHVVEEVALGWLEWARGFVPGVTLWQVAVVNAAFLGLCLAAALSRSLLFHLTMASLVLINLVLHAVPTVAQARLSPGLLSATFLYLPLGLCAFRSAHRDGSVTRRQVSLAVLFGALLMSAPFVLQGLRIALSSR
ncbi:MAG: HXXEE domain-containing protein [Planctomycetota bacterium]|jgi:hypothetical protein